MFIVITFSKDLVFSMKVCRPIETLTNTKIQFQILLWEARRSSLVWAVRKYPLINAEMWWEPE